MTKIYLLSYSSAPWEMPVAMMAYNKKEDAERECIMLISMYESSKEYLTYMIKKFYFVKEIDLI